MKRLAERALSSSGEETCGDLFAAAEIAESLDLDSRRPLRKRLDLVELPFYYYDLMHNPVCRGKHVAANLPKGASTSPDLSLVDPVPSSFWSHPGDIASRDLYTPFGPILAPGKQPCTYEGPKTGYGTKPGFDVSCGDRRLKVKFGNTESSKRDAEVALNRIYDALGYHVEPSDYTPEIKVRYDRRILLEFNSRKDLTITVTAVGFIPIAHIRIQHMEDPFAYIRGAVTKGGATLKAEELAQRLIRPETLSRSPRAAKKLPRGTHPDHYRDDAADFEREIETLVMVEGNVQSRDLSMGNVGPWDWNGRDHPSLRELRAAGLLAAWTNYYDSRWDNNRLKLERSPDAAHGAHDATHDGPPDAQQETAQDTTRPAHLVHVISDLGGSLGNAENFRVDRQGLLNDFPWTFTEPSALDDRGRTQRPFRVVHYQPIDDNDAFREMTLDDARWMARLIGRLTENQMAQALIAAGYTSAEVKLYTAKLVSRRDRMIQDLGLADEVALLGPGGSHRTFDYDPRRDGPVVARAADGSELHPIESRDLVVRAGRVEPR